jgi:hypothetical protein
VVVMQEKEERQGGRSLGGDDLLDGAHDATLRVHRSGGLDSSAGVEEVSKHL